MHLGKVFVDVIKIQVKNNFYIWKKSNVDILTVENKNRWVTPPTVVLIGFVYMFKYIWYINFSLYSHSFILTWKLSSFVSSFLPFRSFTFASPLPPSS